MFDFIVEVVKVIVNVVTGGDSNSTSNTESSNSSTGTATSTTGVVSGSNLSATSASWLSCMRNKMSYIVATSILLGLFAFLISYIDCLSATVGIGLLGCLGPSVLFGLVVAGMWFSFATLISAVNCLLTR